MNTNTILRSVSGTLHHTVSVGPGLPHNMSYNPYRVSIVAKYTLNQPPEFQEEFEVLKAEAQA